MSFIHIFKNNITNKIIKTFLKVESCFSEYIQVFYSHVTLFWSHVCQSNNFMKLRVANFIPQIMYFINHLNE